MTNIGYHLRLKFNIIKLEKYVFKLWYSCFQALRESALLK